MGVQLYASHEPLEVRVEIGMMQVISVETAASIGSASISNTSLILAPQPSPDINCFSRHSGINVDDVTVPIAPNCSLKLGLQGPGLD